MLAYNNDEGCSADVLLTHGITTHHCFLQDLYIMQCTYICIHMHTYICIFTCMCISYAEMKGMMTRSEEYMKPACFGQSACGSYEYTFTFCAEREIFGTKPSGCHLDNHQYVQPCFKFYTMVRHVQVIGNWNLLESFSQVSRLVAVDCPINDGMCS